MFYTTMQRRQYTTERLRLVHVQLEASRDLLDELRRLPSIELWMLCHAFSNTDTACWSWEVLEERGHVVWTAYGPWLLAAGGYNPSSTLLN